MLPPSAVLLASSPTCPVQMFRVGANVYATQFHPELDVDGITTRIHAYADHGYFAADELELTLAAVRRAAGLAPEPDPAHLRRPLRPLTATCSLLRPAAFLSPQVFAQLARRRSGGPPSGGRGDPSARSPSKMTSAQASRR